VDIHPLVGKQAVSVRLCDARINIFEGAVRSSKTISSLIAWLEFIRTGPAGPLLMFGRTERTLIRNLLDPLVEMIGPQRCRIVSGSGIAYILGRKVYLVGANDETSQEKIRGLSLAGGYGDELSTIPSSFWTMFLTRLSIPSARAFGSSNPDGPEHWLKKDYLDRAKLHLTGDGEIIRYDDPQRLNLHRFSFQLADNPSLDADYVRSLHLEHRGLWRRRLVLGEWCMAEGVVYDMFDQDRHVIRGPLPSMLRIPGVGVDVGTVNPTAALMLGIQQADPHAGTPTRLVFMREYRFDSKKAMAQKTDAELSRDLRSWIGTDRPQWVAVDPSAASFKLQLFRDGLSNVMDASNSVLDGVRLMSSLLATNQLVIHESCTGLLTELGSYSWDEKAAKRGEDKPLKVNDHSCDAARYAIASLSPLFQPHLRPLVAA
jgi:PBSX family phage terminase large subunit